MASKNKIDEIDHIKYLLPDESNARVHSARNIGMIVESLQEVGAARSIVIDESGTILAGNGLIEAAGQAGIEKVRVVEASGNEIIAVRRRGLSEEQKKRLALYDNRTAELATWDVDVLQNLNDDDLLNKLWNEKEIKELFQEITATNESAPDAQVNIAEELQNKWQVSRGQIWHVGNHRLMCGDCTVDIPGFVDCKISLMLTDPPYGVGVEYGEQTDDAPIKIRDLITRFMQATEKYRPALITSGHTLIWDYPRPDWILSWVHPAGMGRNPWGFTMVNPILAFGKDPYLANGLGSRPDSLVLAADREDVEGHPVPKPIKVWDWLLERGSIHQGDVILDPFLGSGTTMVSAERLSRVCYGMEIEPKYVAVSLQRMADMGLEPRLLNQ